MKTYDFSGWATRNNVLCADGRTIMRDAFKDNDGQKVPLVWNHQHNDPTNVLGHALLENREEGVYAYCTFNDTEAGKQAKSLVEHGDIDQLSIFANKLKQQGGRVLHGAIREVSLVLAGANPQAYIESIIRHSDAGEAIESEDEAIIYPGEGTAVLYHAEEHETKEEKPMAEAAKNEKTVQDVINSMTEEQKTVMYALIGQALEDAEGDNNSKGGNTMKQNAFDTNDEYTGDVLTHSELEAIVGDAKRYGSMKDAFIAHGIEQIDYLFPEAKTVTQTPHLITRDMGWVQKVMKGVHHTPFSRIKSLFANITEDEARAKGYIKGNLKKEEVFGLLKRTTTPTTVYKKQKIDRDDWADIVDLEVIAFLKSEMRMMLDEEFARAYLVGDGRLASSDDKINEQNIRPIWTDDDLFTIKALVEVAAGASADDKVKAVIRTIIKSRKNYKGSGNPTFFTTEDFLTDCLLLEDKTGRVIYENVAKLATTLRVKEIVTVPVMEGLKREVEGKSRDLVGIIVNLDDYNVGADKGGAVNMFDDFDIDYNQMKYLIEGRCSGALTIPYSAIAVETETATA